MSNEEYTPSDCKSFLGDKKDQFFTSEESPSFYDSAIFLRKKNSDFEVSLVIPSIEVTHKVDNDSPP